VHVPARSGPAYWTVGCMFRFLVTSEQSGGTCATFEATVPPGEGANPHLHEHEDEQFYVIEGELVFRAGDETIEMSAGDFVHVPRGTIHSFENGPTHARLLATLLPGTGLDQVFRDEGVLLDEELAYGGPTPVPPAGATRHLRRSSG